MRRPRRTDHRCTPFRTRRSSRNRLRGSHTCHRNRSAAWDRFRCPDTRRSRTPDRRRTRSRTRRSSGSSRADRRTRCYRASCPHRTCIALWSRSVRPDTACRTRRNGPRRSACRRSSLRKGRAGPCSPRRSCPSRTLRSRRKRWRRCRSSRDPASDGRSCRRNRCSPRRRRTHSHCRSEASGTWSRNRRNA